MRMRIIGYIGMTVTIGLFLQMMLTTYQLAKIDTGLTSSLHSTAQLAEIQKAIIEKNQTLNNVIDTTSAMDQQLNGTLASTQTIQAHIHKIDDLNQSTLNLNQEMIPAADDSGKSLASIANLLNQLNQTVQALHESLQKLQSYIHQDRANLDHMKTDTDEMNQKVPGVGK